MCLVLLGVEISPSFPLILAANRDEFYQRPTAPMDFWPENPAILAGKDLEQGGTWFGINTQGRFAALTNYRDLSRLKQAPPSRGEIIVAFLEFTGSIPDFMDHFKPRAPAYNGFNLLLGQPGQLFWFSNQTRKIASLTPGIHGISNHLLDTPWPKVDQGRKALAKALQDGKTDPETLFSLLRDSSVPADDLLPDTGVGLEWERILSPLFIQSPFYGTRSSLVMAMDLQGRVHLTERTYFQEGLTPHEDRHFSLGPFQKS